MKSSCEVFLALVEPFATRLPSYRCVLGKPKSEQKPGLKDHEDRYLQGSRMVVGVCLLFAGRPAAPIGAGDVTPRSAIVTVNSKSAEDGTTVPRQSMSVYENRKLQEVAGWVPLRGERSGLQLVVLLDDSSRGNLGLQLNDIRSFVTGLPPTTQVAIGYMRNGTPNLVQNFTNDHAQAVKALRLPSGISGHQWKPLFLPLGSGQALAGRG